MSRNSNLLLNSDRFVWRSSIVIGVILFSLGMTLAGLKPLWNDEIFTHTRNVEAISYSEIMRGGVAEGNNSPLFYCFQKALSLLTAYQFPAISWDDKTFFFDGVSNYILRVNPVLCMSLAGVLVYFYFSRYYSFLIGLYALFVFFSPYMMWIYFCEARPYAQWVLFTTWQCLLFLRLAAQEQKGESKLLLWLIVCHWLLCLSTSMGLMQVACMAVILWAMGIRSLKVHIPLTGLPIAVSLFYLSRAHKYDFWFLSSPWRVFEIAVPQEYIFLWAVFGLCLAGFYFWRPTHSLGKTIKQVNAPARNYFFLMTLLLLSGLALLGYLMYKNTGGPKGFVISSRYFIFLCPIITIGTVRCLLEIYQWNFHPWYKVNVLLAAIGWVVIVYIETFMHIYAIALYRI